MSQVPFFPVTVGDRWVEARDLMGLRLDLAGTGLAASFQNPGQYVQLREPAGGVAFLAIASKPGNASFEFLIKAGGAVTDKILSLAPGSRLEASPALGAGYPVHAHTGKDILLLAVGSGISPIRSLIWYLAAQRREYANVTLFFGARTPEHFSYQDELPAWQAEGIQVIRVVSQPGDSGDSSYVHGYIQGAIAAHPIVPDNTVAFVCGMPAMVSAVRDELVKLGIPAGLVIQNV